MVLLLLSPVMYVFNKKIAHAFSSTFKTLFLLMDSSETFLMMKSGIESPARIVYLLFVVKLRRWVILTGFVAVFLIMAVLTVTWPVQSLFFFCTRGANINAKVSISSAGRAAHAAAINV